MADALDGFPTDGTAPPVGTLDRRSPEADADRRPSRRQRSYSRSRSRSRSPYRRSDRDRSDRDRDQRPSRGGPAPPPGGRTGPPVDPSNVLGVFGLSILTTERDLHHEFSAYGQVEKVVIVYDQRSDRSRGFGFVTMSSQQEAEKAIEGLNGLELHQRRMRVDYSATKKPHEPTPGQYMGLPVPVRSDDRYARSGPRYGGGGGGYDSRDRHGDRYGGGGYDSRRSPPRRRFDDYDRDYDRRDRDRGGHRDRSRSRSRDRSYRRRRSPSYGRDRSRSPAARKTEASAAVDGDPTDGAPIPQA